MTNKVSNTRQRKIENSVLVVNKESPIDTLPFISDAMIFVGTYFGLDPDSPKNSRAEVGAGVILEFLAAAIDDVQDAMVDKYLKQKSDLLKK